MRLLYIYSMHRLGIALHLSTLWWFLKNSKMGNSASFVAMDGTVVVCRSSLNLLRRLRGLDGLVVH